MASGNFGSLDSQPALTVANFFAGDAATRGGTRLSLRDLDTDGRADLVVGSGDRLQSTVRIYNATQLSVNPANPTLAQAAARPLRGCPGEWGVCRLSPDRRPGRSPAALVSSVRQQDTKWVNHDQRRFAQEPFSRCALFPLVLVVLIGCLSFACGQQPKGCQVKQRRSPTASRGRSG